MPDTGLATVSALGPRQLANRRPGVDAGPQGRNSARTDQASPQANGGRFTVLAIAIAALGFIGLVMVLSASVAEAQSDFGNPWYQLQRQALWLALGVVALVAALRVDYRKLRLVTRPFMAATMGLLLLVLVVGQTVNGATRWLSLGPVTVQPSELAKLALVLFVADVLADRGGLMGNYRATLVPTLGAFSVLAVLIMFQPNLGTTVLLFLTVLSMLWMAGLSARVVGIMGAVAGTLAGLLAVFEPYRWRRLVAFTDPWEDPLNTGYQTLQSQAALANGGVTGLGLGQGRAKYGFLPEGHTDFIFSNIGEEFGLIGGVVLIGLFVTIAVVGLRVARDAPDRFGMLVAVGITTWVTVQALVNLGAAVGVMPITGVPLPLVSAGGSSLTVTLAACGILLNIARTSRP